MIKSLSGRVSGHFFIATFMVLSVSLLANVVFTHKAMAGFAPVLVGRTIVTSGTDRATGQTYNVATPSPLALLNGSASLGTYFNAASVIRVYKGDKVQFAQITESFDPLNISGFSHLQMHYAGFNDSMDPLSFAQYSGHWPAALGGHSANVVWDSGWPPGAYFVMMSASFAKSPVVTIGEGIAGPGSDRPGAQFCEFVSTNPTIQFYVPYFTYPYMEWKIPSAFDFSLDTPAGPIRLSLLRLMSCAEIAYAYNLQPSIGPVNGGGSSAVSVNPAVSQGDLKDASGFTPPESTYTAPTQWRVSQFFMPTGNLPSEFNDYSTYKGGPLGTDPLCNYFASKGAKACNIPELADGSHNKAQGTSVFNAGGTGSSLTIKSGDPLSAISNLAPPTIPAQYQGWQICYSLSVAKYRPYLSINDAGWRNSKVVCTGGNKKPKVNILGDDVRAGGRIDTSLSQTTVAGAINVFGSWGQYASYSAGETKNFGTAGPIAGLRNGTPNTAPASWSALTFANTVAPYGYFSSSVTSAGASQAPAYLSKHTQVLTHTKLSDISSSGTYTTSGATLGDSSASTADIIPKGRSIVILSSGDVTINQDIKYTTDPLSSINDIPQVVIIAKNIYINHDVTHIDAWLISNGVINTCDQTAESSLTMNTCNKPLRINGPVATNEIRLNRTYGADSNDPGEPAETFDNNGIAYIWAANYFKNSSNLVSTHVLELPPRF